MTLDLDVDLDVRPDLSSILVLVCMSMAVGHSVYFSRELMALDGVVMTIQGLLLMMLALALERWADHG